MKKKETRRQSSKDNNVPLLSEVFEELQKTLDELERANIQLTRQSALIESLKARLISSDVRYKMWEREANSALAPSLAEQVIDECPLRGNQAFEEGDLKVQPLFSHSEEDPEAQRSFFDVFLIAPRLYGVVMGRARGESGGTLAASAFCYFLRVLLWSHLKPAPSLQALNRFLLGDAMRSERLCDANPSIAVASYDALSGEMICASAGESVLPVVWRPEGAAASSRLGSSICSKENPLYQEEIFHLKAGDHFGFFSRADDPEANSPGANIDFNELTADLNDHWDEAAAKIKREDSDVFSGVRFRALVAKVLKSGCPS